MSERANAQSWTCEVQLKSGRLPDLGVLARHLRDCRVGATLRGVEAVVVGSLTEENGDLVLQASETGERLRLAPLRHKVQWDVAGSREQSATPAEREAYERLRSAATARSGPLKVTGPLREAADGGPPFLEVRAFDWRMEEGRPPRSPG